MGLKQKQRQFHTERRQTDTHQRRQALSPPTDEFGDKDRNRQSQFKSLVECETPAQAGLIDQILKKFPPTGPVVEFVRWRFKQTAKPLLSGMSGRTTKTNRQTRWEQHSALMLSTGTSLKLRSTTSYPRTKLVIGLSLNTSSDLRVARS